MITKPFSQDSDKPVIAARLDRQTYDTLRKEAESQRRSLGSLIRIILEDWALSAPAQVAGTVPCPHCAPRSPQNNTDPNSSPRRADPT